MTTVRFKLTAPYRHHAAGETIEIPIHRSWYPRLYGLEGAVVTDAPVPVEAPKSRSAAKGEKSIAREADEADATTTATETTE